MPFKVTHNKWLEVEANRVQDFILGIKFWHRAWTLKSLKEALSELGINYSMPEIREINEELHHRGIIEDVAH